MSENTMRRPGRYVSRRWLIFSVLAGAGVLGLSAARGRGLAESPPDKPLEVVVHINFGDSIRQEHGLKNIENILKTAKGANKTCAISVVCHSEGIVLLEAGKSDHAQSVQALQGQGITFAACENTMRQRAIKKEDLIPGTVTVPSGAYEVVTLQQQGYSYFNP